MRAKRFLYLGGALLGALAILLAVAWLRRPSHPVALLQVIDPSGHPVAGAVIRPDGLRPKRDGGHYLWIDTRDPKPAPVVTDAQGRARVAYPFYTDERLETEQISFGVEHSDYCSDRPFRTVNAAPPANAPVVEKTFYWIKVMLRNVESRPKPVVLKPGAIVEVSGYLDDSNSWVAPLYVQVSEVWDAQTNLWRRTASGVLTSRKIPEGKRVLRLAHLPPGQPAHFSEAVFFTAMPGATNRFHLRLKPGGKIIGRLDESVPRPATSGLAVLDVTPENTPPRTDTVRWHAWSPIATNGTFAIEGLPPGTVEVVALCDGYVSQDGKAGVRGFGYPQQFPLSEGDITVDLAMEPTAAFELTATDERSQPLEGAEVVFWPNVVWSGGRSTIFCTDLYHTAEGLTNTSRSVRNRRQTLYSATTGPDGVAIVTNLPANAATTFTVTHTNSDLPVRKVASGGGSRDRSVKLRPGQTAHESVILQKRGTDHVEHQR